MLFADVLSLHLVTFLMFFIRVHIIDRDLPQSFQVPGSIDNTTHTRLLDHPCQQGQVHGKLLDAHRLLISNSAILSNNFVSLLSDL